MELYRLLKSFDKYIGTFLCSCFLKKRNSVKTVRKILVLRPGGIGDAVILSRVIKFYKEVNPNIVIHILAEKRNYAAFRFIERPENIFCYDKVIDLFRLFTVKYDVIIDTEQWYRLSAVMCRILRSDCTVGFSTNNRSRLYSDTVEYDLMTAELTNFVKLFEKIDSFFLVSSSKIYESITKHKDCLDFDINTFNISKPYVVIFPGASVKEKCWESSKYHSLIQKLQHIGLEVVLVGGPSELKIAEHIFYYGVVNVVGKTCLSETKAIISQACLFVSCDSGLMHIADQLNVPVIALFGPTEKLKWGPIGINSIVISANLDCSPCSKFGIIPSCRFDYLCMKSIDVEDVFSGCVDLLNKSHL